MQEEVDVEHIVMDGGSSDETVQILESLSSDSRLRWVSEPDDGQSDALNKAFSKSTGDWIGWLNADEFYLPGALASVVDCIVANPTADLIYGDFAQVDADGRLKRLVASHEFSEKALQTVCFIPSCTTFIRRDAMPARLWDVQCRSLMDWDLFLELYRAGNQFTHSRRLLAAFRVHADQVTKSSVARSPAEFSLIRGRHGIPIGGSALMTARVIGRSAHIARKVVEGGYLREVRASRTKGRSLRWFDQVDAKALSSLGAMRRADAL
jgi:glycosyltransferase involved in cell wall biosynthesis